MLYVLELFKLAAACTAGSGFLRDIYSGISCNAYGAPQITSVSQMLLIVGNVVIDLMSLAGALAIIFIIVGGIWYVVSMGNSSRIERAKSTITYAVVGLIIVIIAEAVVTFLVQGF
jgi:hypothetical protein